LIPVFWVFYKKVLKKYFRTLVREIDMDVAKTDMIVDLMQ